MNHPECLSEAEKERAKFCIRNIKDKLESIEAELEKEYAYKYYIHEKIEPICWDSKCIENMCKEADDE